MVQLEWLSTLITMKPVGIYSRNGAYEDNRLNLARYFELNFNKTFQSSDFSATLL